jgi:hypothetical protein
MGPDDREGSSGPKCSALGGGSGRNFIHTTNRILNAGRRIGAARFVDVSYMNLIAALHNTRIQTISHAFCAEVSSLAKIGLVLVSSKTTKKAAQGRLLREIIFSEAVTELELGLMAIEVDKVNVLAVDNT